MSEHLFLEERRRTILEHLEKDGRVSVKALSERLNVSAVTIRQDLRALEEEGLLDRTYGGAVLRMAAPILPNMPELSFDIRCKKQENEKQAIARAAADLVQDGFGVALDASSTAFAVTPYLKRYDGLTVVTNSLMVAQQFLDSPRIQVIVPGGKLRRDSISLVGSAQAFPELNLNIGFFGARGLSLQAGITDISEEEVEMKRAMIARCMETVVLIDSTKWGQVTPYTYVGAAGVSRIITSSKAESPFVRAFVEAGVRVDCVSG